MASQAIHYVSSMVNKKPSRLLLSCRVKPNASASREGITAVTQDRIDIYVTAQAKDGEANKAVRELIAEVERPSWSSTRLH